MEKINVGDLIKLDNNKEYVCFLTMEEVGINYVYLITKEKPIEVKFAKYGLNDEYITLVGSKKEKQEILQKFSNIINKD